MSRPSRFLMALAAMAALCVAGAASAQSQHYYDPPGRVARISDMHGPISYSPAGDGDWYGAQRNRPLVSGDALWSDRGGRAEVQAGSTWIRMDQDTSLEIMQLDDRMLQVEVAEGSVNLRVRRLYPGQRVEVDTPNLAYVIDRPGSFRLDVDREGDNTTIEARQGGGRVYGVGGRFDVRNGDVVVFYGEDVRDYEMYAFPAQDGFDRYARMRDQRIDRSVSLHYLGDDLVGYSDLDDYGRWSRYPDYGNVWFPGNVYAGWAPYQDGQWVWQDPWGWTWVDDQPWGFAPSHYGRWAWIDGRWGWVPGPRSYRPVYAPALVAFLEVAGGAIGWFPLGPSDVYYPTYNVSSNYFRAVNVANTTVNTTTVNNVYNSYGRANAVPLAQGAYRNRTVPTAVTAVPQDVFVNSRPVREARRENRDLAAATPPRGLQMRRDLGVRPGRASLRGAAAQANARPPQAVQDEQVIVHNAPPATPAAAPTATSTPAPAAPVRERPRRMRQVSDQQAATDARAHGPRHQGESAAATTPPATPTAATPAAATAPGGGRLQALDRDALVRARGARRFNDRGMTPAPAAPAPATPAPAPAAAPAPTAATAPSPAPAPAAQAPAPAPAPAAQAEQARQAEEARAAQQKAREEQRQAREAQRQAQEQRQQSEAALREAQQQHAQANADTGQQQQAAEADAKAVQERQQARAAAQEAQRQQREAQQAQREAARQQAEAAQAAPKATAPAPSPTPTTPAPAPETAAQPAPRRDCVPPERIDAMRKRGVPEERLAAMKACPVQPQPQQQ